jgi:hypothetical protein
MLTRLTTGMALLATMSLSSCSGEHNTPARVVITSGPEAETPEMTRQAWAEKTCEAAKRKGLATDGLMLVASIREQRMLVLEDGNLLAAYPISTSLYGPGSREGSNKTPLGLHRIRDRIGDAEPPGRVFRARQATGVVLSPASWRQDEAEDLVLTRIMRLDGMTRGLNKGGSVDSYKRFIYIHGTNQEHLLGRPASHGCIRMANEDVITLYETVLDRETWCSIMQGFPRTG